MKVLFFAVLTCAFALSASDNAPKIQLTYPGWKLKALSFSYDDATNSDRRLIQIFDRYKMKGTFHIPSAWIKKVSDKRIQESELKKVYAGHEISGHGWQHKPLARIPLETADAEIAADIRGLQRLTGKKITGYAYPFGSHSPAVHKLIEKHGLLYARTVRKAKNFDLPQNFSAWHPNAHHKNNIDKLGEEYLKLSPSKMTVLLVWGHSYEFQTENNWQIIENFCRKMSEKKEIYYATMAEIALYIRASEKLVFQTERNSFKNASDRELFFKYKDQKIKLSPGAEFVLK